MKTYLLSPTIIALVFLSFNVSATVHCVDLNCTNPVSPYADWTTAATNIQDAVDASNTGDSILVTNGVYQTGGAAVTNAFGSIIESNRVMVTKPLTIQSVNGSGVTTIEAYQAPGTTNSGRSGLRCVWLTNGASLSGFTLMNGYAFFRGLNGGSGGGGVYCLSNATVSDCVISNNSAAGSGGGVYGGTVSNCVIVNNFANSGGGAASSRLINCLLSQNSANQNGGGADSSFLNNCTITYNSAETGGGAYAISSVLPGILPNACVNGCMIIGNVASDGGGTAFTTVNNSILIGNWATNSGGGVYCGTVNNCTLADNSAGNIGGGSIGGPIYPMNPVTMNNCIVYYNSAPVGSNYYFYNSGPLSQGGTLIYCCTTPLPTNGTGNITNEPFFVDLVNGDFHLQSNSPCINAGNNLYVTNSTDLDGNPRISGGTVDIGTYEFQNPASVISYAWLQQYGLTNNGLADYADTDGDGLNNYQEWIAGTNPTNALSVLKMTSAAPTNNPAGLIVTWQSVINRNYFLQRSSDLTAQPAFSSIQSNIVGQVGTTGFLDTAATNSGPYFYRVGVQ
jgi:hypothetical protein